MEGKKKTNNNILYCYQNLKLARELKKSTTEIIISI